MAVPPAIKLSHFSNVNKLRTYVGFVCRYETFREKCVVSRFAETGKRNKENERRRQSQVSRYSVFCTLKIHLLLYLFVKFFIIIVIVFMVIVVVIVEILHCYYIFRFLCFCC